MKDFSASIVIHASSKEQDDIITLFASEDQELSNNRASYDIEAKDNNVVFTIKADDAVALRAITNAICKTLSVFEKMSKV